MILIWKIRYLDRADKQFKDRYLHLRTQSLDPITRAAVELVVENKSHKTEREILKYRHLFTEGKLEVFSDFHAYAMYKYVCPSEYFEDESGKELNDNEIAQILTGSLTARSLPSGATQHDIDFMLAERKPIPVAQVSLTPAEVRVLGYFVRDLQEMQDSAVMTDGPGTLTCSSRVLKKAEFQSDLPLFRAY